MQKLNFRSQPGVQSQASLQGPLAGMPIQSPGMVISGQARPMVSPAHQQTALQKLQEEKELLRKRQEELNRQVGDMQVNIINSTSFSMFLHAQHAERKINTKAHYVEKAESS